MSFEVKLQEYYWITDKENIYVPAKYLSTALNGTFNFESYHTKSQVSCDRSEIICPVTPPLTSLTDISHDLVNSIDISEPYVLWSLRQRFLDRKIYTSIGPIIIALNPYRNLEELYDEELLKKYVLIAHVETDIAPHIWTIARTSYDNLRSTGLKQAIIISGESGAGKTETTKKCLQLLSVMSTEGIDQQIVDTRGEVPIEDKVLGTNPLLESFGNSKTFRNNNSSRFGKWLEIKFRVSARSPGKLELMGANITQYLLEKSRVVFQSQGERNYHIFYQICSNPEFNLGPASSFNYLNQSGCLSIEGVDDTAEYRDTKKAFESLGFPLEDTSAIFSALCAILYIGNLSYTGQFYS